MYLLIDNYDSFTYNLYQIFAEQGAKLLVKRNDKITIEEIAELKPDKIIISPGPKTPREAGISNEVIKKFFHSVPILGICLGHQCIATAFGGKISQVEKLVHGRTSPVHHKSKGIFEGIVSPFPGARYHSLKAIDMPPCLEVTAWTDDEIIMGLKHRERPVIGLQFHPESFLTENGRKIIKNFIEL
ncbi:MAG: aminodeoxychorismate/anthranilate synthase component II [Candidatus Omnitrophota bacterium]